jgi:hypothetical protein
VSLGADDPAGEKTVATVAPLAARIGFWAAALTAAFALLFGVGAVLAAVLFPGRDWQGVEHWAANYSVGATYLTVLPSFCLTFAFVVLLASIHALTPPDRQILSLVGLALALLYAAILDANYFVQLTFVRQEALAGNGAAVGMLAIENMASPSLFWTLEYLGYGLQCLAALAIAPLFGGWTRRCLLLVGGAGVLTFATPMLDLPLPAFVLGGAGWQIGLPIAAILLAHRWYRASHPAR